MSLYLALALSPSAHACDIASITSQLNAFAGSTVVSPSAPFRTRPTTLAARLDGAIDGLVAMGCTVDPDDVWFGVTQAGRTAAGVDGAGAPVDFHFQSQSIWGTQDPDGVPHAFSGAYTSRFAGSLEVDDGSVVVGVHARIAGSRSIWYGVRGTGCDATAAAQAWRTTRHDTTCIADGPERCDGHDNDCDATSDPAGMATFLDLAGVAHDWSSAFETPPATLTIDEPGTLGLCRGTYEGAITVAADASIHGTGADVVLSGGDALRPLDVQGVSLDLQDLQVGGGTTDDDGGCVRLASGSTLTGVDLVFEGCTANDGGAIHGSGADVQLERATLTGNQAAHQGAGLWMEDGSLTLTDCDLSDNDAVHFGGAVYGDALQVDASGVTMGGNHGRSGGALALAAGSSLTLEGAEISGNDATFRGGAIYALDSGVSLADVVFEGNTAATYAGAVYVSDGTVVAEGVTTTANVSGAAGGFFLQDVAASFDGCDFIENVADGSNPSQANVGGGGIVIFGSTSSVTIDGGRFEGNRATNGGAIRTDQGVFTVTGTTIVDNGIVENAAVQSRGGALSVDNSILALVDVTITGHTAEWGGAIWTNGDGITITGGTIEGNSAELGGVLYLGGDTARFDGVQLLGNAASSQGGVVYLSQGALEIEGGEVSGNAAASGGVVWVDDDAASVTLVDTTLSGNSTSDAGAAALSVFDAEVTNTTFAGNTTHDVLNRHTAATFDFAAGETFTCDSAGCD